MYQFFNPNEASEVIIPMYGTVHLITLLAMIVLIAIVIWKKEAIKKLASNRVFLRRFVILYLIYEVIFWILLWVYKVEPMHERFPLHLCGTLSFLMPILLLKEKYTWFRFFTFWSVCAGSISFLNPGFVFEDLWSFSFIHYLIRHYLLILLPIAISLTRGFKHTYREFWISIGALAGYSFLIFLLDWATGANYMHLGQHNPLEIPFLPASFTVWPWTYPSFVFVGIILFHIVFLGFSFLEKGKTSWRKA